MKYKKLFFLISAILISAFLTACSPKEQIFAPQQQPAHFEQHKFIASDGASLAMRSWLPKGKPKAIIIALHGMNDYSHAFAGVGEYFSARGIALYAYDQRGFGASPSPGIWPGLENLKRDLREFTAALSQTYPGKPVYVLGESMGGAVAIAALANNTPPLSNSLSQGEGELKVAGVILSAPAVWGDGTLGPMMRVPLWIAAYSFPSSLYDGSDLKILASNNIPMLRELSKDPLVLKRTRADAILGLVRLMDYAYAGVSDVRVPVLLLYGGKDQVIPPQSIDAAIGHFERPILFAYYPDGYHMLMRDLQAETVLRDIESWIRKPNKALPSRVGRIISPEK